MTHPNKKILTAVKFAGFAAAAAMLCSSVGCQSDQSSVTDFFPSDESRSTRNCMTAQAASGARADATLQSMHFDDGSLNSLGEAKLDLMLKDDDSTEAMTIYMNLDSDDPHMKNRRDAVVSYLEDRGVPQDVIEFKAGTNPNVTSFSAEHIGNMKKTESGGGEDTSASTSSGSSASSAQTK